MKVLLILAFLAAPAHTATPVREPAIEGAWCAGSTNAFHEEFSLDIVDGVHVFSSWLHQRPALRGTWELKGRTLTIRGSQGDDLMEYTVVSSSRRRLVLRESGRKDRETYVRIGAQCVEFGNAVPD